MWASVGVLVLLGGLALVVLLGLVAASAVSASRKRLGTQAGSDSSATQAAAGRRSLWWNSSLWSNWPRRSNLSRSSHPLHSSRSSRPLPRLATVLCLALSAFFFYAWYAFYWKWDFNELGRYYDPVEQVVYTSSGFVWILPATLLLAAGVAFIWRGWRR